MQPADIRREALKAGFTEQQATFFIALLLMIYHDLQQAAPEVCPSCLRKPPQQEGGGD